MRRFTLFLICISLFFITGCNSNIGTGIFFGPDGGSFGGGTILFLSDTQRSTLTQQDIQLINNVKESARQNGYTVTDNNTAGTVGFRASKHIDNISKNDIDGLPPFVIKDGSRFITVKQGNPTDHYILSAVVDLRHMNRLVKAESAIDSLSKINFRMNLPVEANKTNAERISANGKCLEWTLTPGERTSIKAEFDVKK